MCECVGGTALGKTPLRLERTLTEREVGEFLECSKWMESYQQGSARRIGTQKVLCGTRIHKVRVGERVNNIAQPTERSLLAEGKWLGHNKKCG